MNETPAPPAVGPALDPDDWARVARGGTCALDICSVGERGGGDLALYESENTSVTFLAPWERHALAALALHRQPFGFTAADVALLDVAVVQEQYEAEPDHVRMAHLAHLANRLAALLPPRETPPSEG